jgi:hypothetical protein
MLLATTFLTRCSEPVDRGIRYELKAKSGALAVIHISADQDEVAVTGLAPGATRFVAPYVFRDRGTIGKVWASWDVDGRQMSILLCQSEGTAVEFVNFDNVWGGMPHLAGGLQPSVYHSVRRSFRGYRKVGRGREYDDWVGLWFCSAYSDPELARFTEDGGRTYKIP